MLECLEPALGHFEQTHLARRPPAIGVMRSGPGDAKHSRRCASANQSSSLGVRPSHSARAVVVVRGGSVHEAGAPAVASYGTRPSRLDAARWLRAAEARQKPESPRRNALRESTFGRGSGSAKRARTRRARGRSQEGRLPHASRPRRTNPSRDQTPARNAEARLRAMMF